MIDVPKFYQPKDSFCCGQVCAKMILAYHGIDKSLESIIGSLPVSDHGTSIPSLGAFFLDHGFDVTIKMWFPKSWDKRKTKNAAVLSYLEKGGRFVAQSVTMRDIEKTMAANPVTGKANPCIINLAIREARHYVIPVGFIEDLAYINDPAAENDGNPVAHPLERALNVCGSKELAALFPVPKT